MSEFVNFGFDQGSSAVAIDARAQERLLSLLRQIADAGGAIEPIAQATASEAYGYALAGDDVRNDLRFLAARDYLAPQFFDRVSLCPKCDSHHLNVREICPSCRRANIVNDGLLHHFRCGYVGIPSEFTPSGTGAYVCPKCNGKMHHLGVEYDRLGRAFVCRSCAVISENPPVEAVCLACGVHSMADVLPSASVFGYRLTSRGAGALRAGALFGLDEAPLTVVEAPAYRRSVMLEFLAQEARRLETLGGVFSLLLVTRRPEAPECDPGDWLTRLRGCLRAVDVLGQLGDAFYVVILPQATQSQAETVAAQARVALGEQFDIRAAEITQAGQLSHRLAGLYPRDAVR